MIPENGEMTNALYLPQSYEKTVSSATKNEKK